MREDSATNDRRTRPGLRFDPDARTMSLGDESVTLPRHVGNQAVLRAYVELAARCRGNRPAELVDVRQNDLDALTLALDLGAEDLAQQIERVLGATPVEAVRFVTRLWENRLVGGVAKTAAGVVVAGSLMAGAGAVAAAARPETGPAANPTTVTTTVTPGTAPGTTPSTDDAGTTTTTDMTAAGGWQSEDEPVIDGPLTTTPDGVGLIPPVTEDADGVVLIPPASIDQ